MHSEKSEAIRVALVGPLPPPAGGIASWTRRMLDSEELAGEVEFLHVDESVSGGRTVFGQGSKRSLVGEAKRCARIWKDLKAALERGAQVVHANVPASTTSLARELVCALISKRAGVPFVIHLRCTVPITASRGVSRVLLGAILWTSTAAIVLNSSSEAFVRGVSKTPVYLIPNFVSTNELERGKAVASKEKRGHLNRVLYAGGIVESKGAFDIVEVARALPGVTFRMAGAGRFPPYLEIPANVELLGQLDREALAEEYALADAFLFLTRFKCEGFSNSLAEAMCMGLPCVVTDWAANADMVGDGGGFVVGCGDVVAAVGALQALDDPELRAAMGKKNREKAADEYSERVVVARYLDVYKKVVGSDGLDG